MLKLPTQRLTRAKSIQFGLFVIVFFLLSLNFEQLSTPDILDEFSFSKFAADTERSDSSFTAKEPPGQLTFGPRHGHRLAHIWARNESAFPSNQDDEFLRFDPKLVHPEFQNTPIIHAEASFFRFDDAFGLINTGWSDAEVLEALQQLINIYAQGKLYCAMALITFRFIDWKFSMSTFCGVGLSFWVYSLQQSSSFTTDHFDFTHIVMIVIGLSLFARCFGYRKQVILVTTSRMQPFSSKI
jgi:hypothetical protein